MNTPCRTTSSTSRIPAGRARRQGRSGFTLLEMLVVIVVMAMLMGITFRMVKPSEKARRNSETLKTLQLANAAIAEYQAEYGIYPPVRDDIPYSPWLNGGLRVKGETDEQCGIAPGKAVGYLGPRPATLNSPSQYIKRKDKANNRFVFGLVSFLIDRRDTDFKDGAPGFTTLFKGMGSSGWKKFFGSDSWWYESGRGVDDFGRASTVDKLYDALEPSSKDLAFYKRINTITSKIVKSKGASRAFNDGSDTLGECFYYTIRDSFTADGRELIYICPPPYTSYALFSAGPDGLVVTTDPLNPDAVCPKCKSKNGVDPYHNKDNIYTSANMK